jgi:hypothetical protein
MGSPHLEEELIGGDVDLDLLFQIPQKDARIIGGKGEEASFSRSTMVGNFCSRTLVHLGKKTPFYTPSQI